MEKLEFNIFDLDDDTVSDTIKEQVENQSSDDKNTNDLDGSDGDEDTIGKDLDDDSDDKSKTVSENDNDSDDDDSDESDDDDSVSDDLEDESEEDDSIDESKKDKSEEDNIETDDVGKTLLEYIDKGYLLLPDDYEYEDSEDAIEKAFADSERYRNELAVKEAVNFLLSEKGSELIKIKDSKSEMLKYSEINVDELNDDQAIALIEKGYAKMGFSEEDIEEKITDLQELDKVGKEASKIVKYLAKDQEKEFEKSRKQLEQDKLEKEKTLKQSINLIKKTLSQEEINGYRLSKKTKDNAISTIFETIQTEDKRVSTRFNELLNSALDHPAKLLVLADMLENMDDEGFNFPNLETKINTKNTQQKKKQLRTLRSGNQTKAKITGKKHQTKRDFDLSEASFLNFDN